MRYLTRFVTHDPVLVLKQPSNPPVMILPQMELERAGHESVATCLSRQEAGYYEIIKDEEDPWRILAIMVYRLVNGPILVPPSFPVALARAYQSFASVFIDSESRFEEMRAVKSRVEADNIRRTQMVAETALDKAVNLIRSATVQDDILLSGTEPLTSERVKFEIQYTLMLHGCSAQDTIVACGRDTAMPHCTGSGPLISHEPIVIDIFPRDDATGYHADMTRTISKGEPDSKVIELFQAVCDAEKMAELETRAGVLGSDLHQRVKDWFADQGFASDTEGFIHSLGHGIGLCVHEQPYLSPLGGSLSEGNIVTIEPGLYYRGIGGVRIENMGMVTADGFDRFTRYPIELII